MMMLKGLQKVTALLLACGITCSGIAQTDLDPKQLLEKMHEAANQLNYEIAFVQTTPNSIESLRYRHFNIEGKPYAQLITLDGLPQEIIQRDNLVSYFQANYPSFSISSRQITDYFPAVLRTDLKTMTENYDLINIGRNRVADHIVQTIRILPKDDFRYQYLIFISEQNNLLLRSDILDRDDNLLEQYRVVNLHLSNGLTQVPQQFVNTVTPPLLIQEPQDKTQPEFNWQPTWTPKGFKLINRHQVVENGTSLESQLYSDGLFSFTLYVSDNPVSNTTESIWRQGAITIYSENKQGKELTFIGQLPIATAKRIVQDIQFK